MKAVYRVTIRYAYRLEWDTDDMTGESSFVVDASSPPGAIRKAFGLARRGLTRYCVDNIFSVVVDRA